MGHPRLPERYLQHTRSPIFLHDFCPGPLALIHNVPRVQDNWNSFHVGRLGVRPSLIIEVVSPHDRDVRQVDTVTKLIEYHVAMVPLYVIVDREHEDDWPTIRGYRYTLAGYEPIALDDRDCLLLNGLGLRLCANQNRIALYDAETGEEVGDYTAISEALEAEVAARKAAEEAARLAHEQARLAQDRAQAETEARRKADEAARQAEENRRKADEERKQAQDRLQAELAARADLERRLRELEARLAPPE